MAWKDIIGHEKQIEMLRRAIKLQRLPNAYLFLGPKGIGKEAIALEVAKILNCLSSEALERAEACGECESCKQAETLSHSNIELIFPSEKILFEKTSDTSKEKEAALEQVKRLKELKIQNPYFSMRMDRATGILVSQIDYIQEKALYKPRNGKKRVFIISQAEELSRPQAAAANKLLKLLEEPPEYLHFILVSAYPEQLLPTIISRCQPVRFTNLSNTVIENRLREIGFGETESAFAARFSRGNFNDALLLTEGKEAQASRDRAIEFLRALLSKERQLGMIAISEDLSRRDKSRETQTNFLVSLLLVFEDAIRIISGKEKEDILNADQWESMQRFAKNFSGSDFEAASKYTEEAIRAITRNANTLLVLLGLGLKLRKVIKPKTVL
ncbi:MAG: DNA polymerase III subunit [Chloroherpetonaceae bacterium]|nr:DNA polymerase III subunit [Chloroherpetonaceae bacterium]